jgi:Dolichyl-phosphate-mannose-protein mannosyltransferase
VRNRSLLAILLVAAAVLTSAAWLRSAEYDEQYTLFVTGGVARPVWSTDAFPAGEVRHLQAGHAGFAAIAHDLRTTDVHPPLYFWLVAAWRSAVGDGLFAARLVSVLCSVATLCVVAVIARLAAIPAGVAVLLTLGCYGFVYTGSIARGFALAQLLTMSGVALLLLAKRRRHVVSALVAGTLFGAATFTNYLAVFVAIGALLWLVVSATTPSCRRRSASTTVLSAVRQDVDADLRRHDGPRSGSCGLLRVRFAMPAVLGFAAWLPADLWFYLAQRQSRVGQFASFDAAAGAIRLAQYAAANLLGGLPWYLDGTARAVAYIALAIVLAVLLALTIWQWRSIGTPGSRLLFTMTALAPPTGLLVLGFVFNNTPIELRYLAYCTPFIGLLLAGTFAALPRRAGRTIGGVVLAIQAMALIGLMVRPETMQPARETAAAAASLAQDGVVLLPHGNDGVGIVGAFAIEAPPALRLLVVGRDEAPEEIRARANHFPRVVLALLGQDADSRATLPAMRAAFADACWRNAGEGFNVLAFDRVCGEECPCPSKASR